MNLKSIAGDWDDSNISLLIQVWKVGWKGNKPKKIIAGLNFLLPSLPVCVLLWVLLSWDSPLIPFVLSLHPTAVLPLNFIAHHGCSLGCSVHLPTLQHLSAIILFAQQTPGRRFTHPGTRCLSTPWLASPLHHGAASLSRGAHGNPCCRSSFPCEWGQGEVCGWERSPGAGCAEGSILEEDQLPPSLVHSGVTSCYWPCQVQLSAPQPSWAQSSHSRHFWHRQQEGKGHNCRGLCLLTSACWCIQQPEFGLELWCFPTSHSQRVFSDQALMLWF